jgi:hypothetical protein
VDLKLLEEVVFGESVMEKILIYGMTIGYRVCPQGKLIWFEAR